MKLFKVIFALCSLSFSLSVLAAPVKFPTQFQCSSTVSGTIFDEPYSSTRTFIFTASYGDLQNLKIIDTDNETGKSSPAQTYDRWMTNVVFENVMLAKFGFVKDGKMHDVSFMLKPQARSVSIVQTTNLEERDFFSQNEIGCQIVQP